MAFTINIAVKYPDGTTKVQPNTPWIGVLTMFGKLLKQGIRPMVGDIITDNTNTIYKVNTLVFNQSTNIITVVLE